MVIELKPKYEKPIDLPLGVAVKGSGECNAGSAVMPGQIPIGSPITLLIEA